MTTLKAGAAANFLARPDRSRRAFLVFGPDQGLVSEHVGRLVEACLGDNRDPFALVKLDADLLSSDPGRVSDEMATIGMFGGERVIWLRAVDARIDGRLLASALTPVIDSDMGGYLIVEAGELAEKAPLRRLFDAARQAVALPFYPDGDAELARLIDEEMSEAGLTISKAARDGLLAMLGGDRLASRQELRKLALYCRGQGEVGEDDVMAICGDVSALAIDAVIDAMGLGERKAVSSHYRRLTLEDAAPDTIVALAMRHMLTIYLARLDVDRGRSPRDVRESLRPPIFFKRHNAFDQQLRLWTSPKARLAHSLLTEAALDIRRQFPIALTLGERALLRVASLVSPT